MLPSNLNIIGWYCQIKNLLHTEPDKEGWVVKWQTYENGNHWSFSIELVNRPNDNYPKIHNRVLDLDNKKIIRTLPNGAIIMQSLWVRYIFTPNGQIKNTKKLDSQ
ncbi:MAG: hypothetical protein ACKKL5_00730 [Candidatus Komeilibacteria bacterium]